MISMMVQNMAEVRTWLKTSKGKEIKTLQTAMKVEGYRLMRLLKTEIKGASPGGKTFAPLTELAKRTTARRSKGSPLKRLAIPVRYNVRPQEPYTVEIGYVDTRRGRISKSWKKIAEAVQEGRTFPVTDRLRAYLGMVGAPHKKGEQSYVLKKATKTLKIPSRPIILPFWRAHEREAFQKIKINYERKMRGERI